jgi:CheY-like chemotaxis protein
MIATSAAAGDSRAREEFVLFALRRAAELLDAGCAVFYPVHYGARIDYGCSAELDLPATVGDDFIEHLRGQADRTLLSADWQGLEKLLGGAALQSSSSIWIAVRGGGTDWGTLALFDHIGRRFDRLHRRIALTIAGTIAMGLQLRSQHSSAKEQKSETRAVTPWPNASAEFEQGFAAAPRGRVLLVQPESSVFEFERSVLSALGADTVAVSSGREALEALRDGQFEAVIVDDELEPSFPAGRLIQWIEEHRPELSERVLLTISRTPAEQIRELIEQKIVPHITKPLQVQELYSRSAQLLRSSRQPLLLQ